MLICCCSCVLFQFSVDSRQVYIVPSQGGGVSGREAVLFLSFVKHLMLVYMLLLMLLQLLNYLQSLGLIFDVVGVGVHAYVEQLAAAGFRQLRTPGKYSSDEVVNLKQRELLIAAPIQMYVHMCVHINDFDLENYKNIIVYVNMFVSMYIFVHMFGRHFIRIIKYRQTT